MKTDQHRRKFKFSGVIGSDNHMHQLEADSFEDHLIPPTYVNIPGIGKIP